MSEAAFAAPLAPGHGSDRASAIVEAWCRLDHAGAFLEADHPAIDGTRALRHAVSVELLQLAALALAASPGEAALVEPDLLDTLAALGRTFAEAGASPTLAALSVSHLLAVLLELGLPLVLVQAIDAPARSALFESYVLVRSSLQHDEAARRWEYPACVVRHADGHVSLAAGHPDSDEEALVGWASRAAHGLSLEGVRAVVVSGSDRAVRAVAEALDLAGIVVAEGEKPKGRSRRS